MINVKNTLNIFIEIPLEDGKEGENQREERRERRKGENNVRKEEGE